MTVQASGDTPSTPAAAAAPATAPSSVPAASPEAPATIPATAPSAPAATDSPPAPNAATVETAPTAESPQAPAPAAFTLPTDLKLAPEAISKFETFLKGKSPGTDGKFTMSAQELVDNYADQARVANQRWQAQLVEQDKTWAAESKVRFSAPQLAAAETGIGFLTSFEPAFRELAQSFRNHPSFVNAMRVVGERLSEDTFEIAGAPPTPARRSAKDILYPKRPN